MSLPSHTSREEFRVGYLRSPKLPSVLGTLQPRGLSEALAITVLRAPSGLCGTTCSSCDPEVKGKDRDWKRDNSINYMK